MLRWIEGFEGFGSLTGSSLDNELTKKYTEADVDGSIEDGRGGGKSLYCGGDNARDFSLTLDNQQTWIIGFAFYTATTPPGSVYFLTLKDGGAGGSVQFQLKFYSDGLRVYRGLTGLLEEKTGLFSTNTWYYIELKVKIDNSTGTYEVKINGNTELSGSSVDTQDTANAYANNIRFSGTGIGHRFDDIYICDATGSKNNNFLGEMKVEILFPDGDTADADWTCSTGTDHYALVDENPSNDDTDYVESETLNHIDLYTYEDISGAPDIWGIQINTQARITTVSDDLYFPIKSGSTIYPGIAQTVSSDSFRTFVRVEEDDPDTSTDWVVAGINAARFGVKVG